VNQLAELEHRLAIVVRLHPPEPKLRVVQVAISDAPPVLLVDFVRQRTDQETAFKLEPRVPAFSVSHEPTLRSRKPWQPE
jgi:hypothetical protein